MIVICCSHLNGIFNELGPEDGSDSIEEVSLIHWGFLHHFKIGLHMLWSFHAYDDAKH